MNMHSIKILKRKWKKIGPSTTIINIRVNKLLITVLQ